MRKLLSYPKWSLAAALVIAAAGVAVGSELGIISSGPSPEATTSPSPTASSSVAAEEIAPGTGLGGGTQDHVILSINRQDGKSHPRSGVGRALVNGDTADNDNTA